MNKVVHVLTDAFALASVAMDKSGDGLAPDANAIAPFNVFVIDESGNRTLVRENISAQLSAALVNSANHGAKIQGLARTYVAELAEEINRG